MSVEDLSMAAMTAPPRNPVPAEAVTASLLTSLGRQVAQRTWSMGVERWFWGEGVALMGLSAFGAAVDESQQSRLCTWFSARAQSVRQVAHVNQLAPAATGVQLDNAQEHLLLWREMARWVLSHRSAPRSRNGAIEHWPDGVWADTMFMAGSFLSNYALLTHELKPLREAGTQFIAHAELLQDPTTGLFAHGSYRGETLWNYWGRANAWACLAGLDFLAAAREVDDLAAMRGEIADRVALQLGTLARLLPDHGVWDVLVDRPAETAGIIDTSAAAGIAAAMLEAGSLIPDAGPGLRDAGWASLRGCLAFVDEHGTLTNVTAGTILQLAPFGYSVIRSDLPQLWGQGLVLRAIAGALSLLSGSTELRKSPA